MHPSTRLSSRLFTLRPWLALAPCACALLGCDRQAPADYSGEPLLSMRGRVELALEHPAEASLVPALAFRNHESSELRIVDVEVSGEFPAEFALDVYLPPPPSAFVAISEHVDEPEVALGYIAAVTPDHPATIRFAGGEQSGGGGATDGEQVSIAEWCTADGDECYRETTTCPSVDSPREECETSGEGDPALKQDPWEHFAGLSENYAVVYLSKAVPADSYTSYLLGGDGPLARGYHLLKLEPDPRADEEGICGGEAEQLAAQRYNDRHDSDHTLDELMNSGCASSDEDCLPERARDEFATLRELAKVELDCPNDVKLTAIAHPEREAISVRIGDDLSPFGH